MAHIEPERCTLCNGTTTEVALKTGRGDFRLTNINKLFTLGSAIRIYVCTSCGYIYLYAQNLERLLKE